MATQQNKKSGGARKIGRNAAKYSYRKSEALKVHALGQDSGKSYVRTDAAGQEWNWQHNRPAWLGNRMVKTSHEKRHCGPVGKHQPISYKRVPSMQELEDNRIMMALTSRIHISFANPKAARMAGSNLDIYEAQFEKLSRNARAQMLSDIEYVEGMAD